MKIECAWDKRNNPNSVGNYTVIHYYIKNILQCCDWLIKMKYLQIVMKSPNLAGTGYYSAKKNNNTWIFGFHLCLINVNIPNWTSYKPFDI